MAVNGFMVLRSLNEHIRALDKQRMAARLPIDYVTPKEAMLNLHIEWQDLQDKVKKGLLSGKAAVAAVRLAAAAIKFATDIGETADMGLDNVYAAGDKKNETVRTSETKKKKIRLDRAD